MAVSDAVLERIQTELYVELVGLVDDNALNLLIDCVVRWRKTGNAYHMLFAMNQCRGRSIPLQGILASEHADACRALFEGRSLGTAGNVSKSAMKNSAIFIMVSLRYAELTVAQAASKASAWSASKGQPLKASTLEKYYEQVSDSNETHYFALWNRQPNLRSEMITFAERMPDAPPELRSERR
jgi:hypothetical protein